MTMDTRVTRTRTLVTAVRPRLGLARVGAQDPEEAAQDGPADLLVPLRRGALAAN